MRTLGRRRRPYATPGLETSRPGCRLSCPGVPAITGRRRRALQDSLPGLYAGDRAREVAHVGGSAQVPQLGSGSRGLQFVGPVEPADGGPPGPQLRVCEYAVVAELFCLRFLFGAWRGGVQAPFADDDGDCPRQLPHRPGELTSNRSEVVIEVAVTDCHGVMHEVQVGVDSDASKGRVGEETGPFRA